MLLASYNKETIELLHRTLQYNKQKVWVPYNTRKPQSRQTLINNSSPSQLGWY